MQILILAGGLGTRLRPLTENFPKSMIPVMGHPFLKYQIHYLLSQGVSDIVLVTGFQSSIVEDYVSTQGWRSKVKILNEGNRLRGTGGAIAWAVRQGTMADKFLVLYGDSFLPIPFKPVVEKFQNSQSEALMTVLKNEGNWDQSNVVFEKGDIQLYDKKLTPKPANMKHIDYGLLGLKRSWVQSWSEFSDPDLKFDLADKLTEVSRLKKLAGSEVTERFYEIGSFQGLADFERLVANPPWREFFDFKSGEV